jgi:hypothetical protein
MSQTDLNEMDKQVWKFTTDWTVVRLVGEMISLTLAKS